MSPAQATVAPVSVQQCVQLHRVDGRVGGGKTLDKAEQKLVTALQLRLYKAPDGTLGIWFLLTDVAVRRWI